MSAEEFDYLAEDGKYYILNSTSEVYHMGKKLEVDNSEEAIGIGEFSKEFIANPEADYSRRTATNQCWFQLPDNTFIALTQVSGNGQGSTYWITVISPTGQMSTMQNPGLSCSQVKSDIVQSIW
jgi:hypothetical protein